MDRKVWYMLRHRDGHVTGHAVVRMDRGGQLPKERREVRRVMGIGEGDHTHDTHVVAPTYDQACEAAKRAFARHLAVGKD